MNIDPRTQTRLLDATARFFEHRGVNDPETLRGIHEEREELRRRERANEAAATVAYLRRVMAGHEPLQ